MVVRVHGRVRPARAAEELVLSAADVDVVVVCPSNVYGSGDALKASRKTQLQVARGRMPFYTDGGINIVRVQEVVEAFVAAWQRGRRGERYIIGGENVTVKELLRLYADAAGVAPPAWRLPSWALNVAGHLGLLPLEVRALFLFDCRPLCFLLLGVPVHHRTLCYSAARRALYCVRLWCAPAVVRVRRAMRVGLNALFQNPRTCPAGDGVHFAHTVSKSTTTRSPLGQFKLHHSFPAIVLPSCLRSCVFFFFFFLVVPLDGALMRLL